MTNGDRIRAMTDEELAEWMGRFCDCVEGRCAACDICVPVMEDMGCADRLLEWLKTEGEE